MNPQYNKIIFKKEKINKKWEGAFYKKNLVRFSN
jgi:hypothetical protein